jgi:gamma-glutamyl phosphate reductase
MLALYAVSKPQLMIFKIIPLDNYAVSRIELHAIKHIEYIVDSSVKYAYEYEKMDYSLVLCNIPTFFTLHELQWEMGAV